MNVAPATLGWGTKSCFYSTSNPPDVGKPFQEAGLTATLPWGPILDLYHQPPFTRHPTCDLSLCNQLRRFYVVIDQKTKSTSLGWVDDRGQLSLGRAFFDEPLRGHNLSPSELKKAFVHLRAHHQVYLTPHRFAGVRFWVPHTIGDVRKEIGYVGGGTDLSHLL